eukprot:scaffold1034_cov418-Prasinococcus_capsulatus_cf.AAC.21
MAMYPMTESLHRAVVVQMRDARLSSWRAAPWQSMSSCTSSTSQQESHMPTHTTVSPDALRRLHTYRPPPSST